MAYAIDTSNQRRRRALRAATPLAALLLAALLVWQGSNAAFSATTANNANTWETGNLVLRNNGGTATYAQITTTGLFGELNLKPTNTGVKCITVESTGSLPGSLRLYRGAITGTNNSAGLASALDLTITGGEVGAAVNVAANCTGFPASPTSIYSGTLTGLPQTYATAAPVALAGGARRYAYRIEWTVNASATETIQSSSAVTSLTWEIN